MLSKLSFIWKTNRKVVKNLDLFRSFACGTWNKKQTDKISTSVLTSVSPSGDVIAYFIPLAVLLVANTTRHNDDENHKHSSDNTDDHVEPLIVQAGNDAAWAGWSRAICNKQKKKKNETARLEWE